MITVTLMFWVGLVVSSIRQALATLLAPNATQFTDNGR